MTGAAARTLVCIPADDEADSLPLLLHRLAEVAPEVDVLVLGDDSPAGTGAIADEFADADERIHVLHRPGGGGPGAAYLAGFSWGLEAGYDVLVGMDADGSHRPADLPRLLDALHDADLVLGSRWTPGGRTVDRPLRRRLLSWTGNGCARLLLRLPARDVTGGFRAYRGPALRSLDLPTVGSEGSWFQVELVLRAQDAGLRIREVPITFVERAQGAGRTSSAVVLHAMRSIPAWGVRRAVEQWSRHGAAARTASRR